MIGTRRPLLALLVAAILATARPAPIQAGPVFAPGTALFVARTRHFDIIFPERSRASAMRLREFAESVYYEVAGKLAASLPDRVPVAITPDIGSFDGYSQPFPYAHI